MSKRTKCDECRHGNKPVNGKHYVIVGYRLQLGADTVAIREWVACPKAQRNGADRRE